MTDVSDKSCDDDDRKLSIEISHKKNNNLKFAINPRTSNFKKHFYPKCTNGEWNDWKWQLKNRIITLEDLSKLINISNDENAVIKSKKIILPLAITPYYASLIDTNNPLQPIRKTVVPINKEYIRLPEEAKDPLGEYRDSPVPCIVHRYPDRVLFLVTTFCSSHCRFCTRTRIVGKNGDKNFNTEQWKEAISYIENNKSIRDVLLSGGDPLTLSDNKLEWLIKKIKKIPHVEFIRIGTKVPVVLPQRMTSELICMLKKYQPIWMSIHFTHPDELTSEVKQACNKLADAGIPLGSQTVLLKDVNDNIETIKKLYHGLLQLRVKPYYLYQCDMVIGAGHFRTSISKGLEIIQSLRGFTSGYAVPTYVVDAPGGGGKIPLLPDYVIKRKKNSLVLKNYEGKTYEYYDPEGK